MSNKKGRDFWVRFFRTFKSMGDDVTLVDYCKKRKVVYQTARNWRTKLDKEMLEKSQESQATSTVATSTDKTGTGTLETSTDDIEASTLNVSGTGAKKLQPQPKNNPSPTGEGGKCSQKEIAAKPISGSIEPKERPAHWFKKGHQTNRTHGAYSKYLPPDIQEKMHTYGRNDIQSLEDEINLTHGRIIQLQQVRAKWDAKADYDELKEEDYTLVSIETRDGIQGADGGIGSETKQLRERPKFEDVEDKLVRRMAWLKQVHNQLSKQITLTANEAVLMRYEIMERGIAEGWTATETGAEMEMLGLEVPFTIQQRVRAEMALIEPEEVEGGMSDDDLEARAIEYAEIISNEDEKLKERKDALDDLYSIEQGKRESV